MILYFLRHGLAEERETWNGDDASRPLTDKGKKKLVSITEKLAGLDLDLDLILTSPYLRALQTAEIVAKGLHQPDDLQKDSRLAPGFGLPELSAIVQDHPDNQCIMFVGHEPDFSQTVSDLIGGGRLLFKKAGLARVDLFELNPLQGELAWFFPPRLII